MAATYPQVETDPAYTAGGATDVELAAAIAGVNTALAAKQESSTAATDAELTAAVDALNTALAAKQDAATAATDAEVTAAIAAHAAGDATDAELAAAVASLTASIALKQDAATAATDTELADEVAALEALLAAHEAGDATDAELTAAVDALTTLIGTKQAAATAATDVELAAHEADTTNVHGIADTATLVLASDVRLSDARSPLDGSVTPAKIAADNQPPDISGTARRMWLPTGAKIENLPRHQVLTSDQAILTSGALRLFPLGLLRAGDSLASITLRSGSQAAVSPTNQWAGIVSVSSRELLAVSGNAASGAWVAFSGKTFTFESAYTAAADILLWGCVLVTAGTVPNLRGVSFAETLTFVLPTMSGDSNTGLTSPLAVGTIVNAPSTGGTPGRVPYAYAS